jgi:hypothetical protein
MIQSTQTSIINTATSLLQPSILPCNDERVVLVFILKPNPIVEVEKSTHFLREARSSPATPRQRIGF